MRGERKEPLSSPFGERADEGGLGWAAAGSRGCFQQKFEQGRGRPDTPSPPEEHAYVCGLCIIDPPRKGMLSPCSKYDFN